MPAEHRASRVFYTAKELELNGCVYKAVAYTESNVRALRSENIHVVGPILHYYNWPTSQPPLKSQKHAAEFFSIVRRGYNTSQMGCGKTRATCYNIDYGLRSGLITRVLIVAPLSTLNVVWFRELFTEFKSTSPVVLYGTRDKRLKLFKSDNYNVHIINHDALHIISDKAAGYYDMVVIDELSAFRTKNTRRWRHMNAIINGKQQVPYVIGLTGTPTPNAPTDAWAQCKLITPHTVPKSFVRFRDLTMTQVTQFKWVNKPNAAKLVADAMQPCVRFTREECFDLPPVTFSDREAEFSSEQREAYSTMMKHFVVESSEGRISAVNEGVKINKLLQICGGYVYTDSKKTIPLNPKRRLDVLNDVLGEAQGKVIVFATFIHVVDAVYEALKARGHDVARVYGATSSEERDHIFRTFQNSEGIQVLVAHPKTMSHGLTLTAASTIVWYLPTTSSETYTQANSRISRGGQAQHQHIVHLIGSEIEKRAYKRLQGNLKVQGILLDLLQTQTAA